MSKVDLKTYCGLPIILDNGKISDDSVTNNSTECYGVENIRGQLLNSEINAEDLVYTKYCNVFENLIKKTRISIYQISSCLIGIEYSKTQAHISQTNTILDVAYGGGLIVLQNFENEHNQVIFSILKRGSKIIIPKDWHYSITNTKSTPLIVVEYTDFKSSCKNVLDDMNGMSYYVIRKNAKYELVKNPNYKFVNDINKFSFDKTLKSFGITTKLPISTQFNRKYETLFKIFNSSITL